jgi:hypothetical protein
VFAVLTVTYGAIVGIYTHIYIAKFVTEGQRFAVEENVFYNVSCDNSFKLEQVLSMRVVYFLTVIMKRRSELIMCTQRHKDTFNLTYLSFYVTGGSQNLTTSLYDQLK